MMTNRAFFLMLFVAMAVNGCAYAMDGTRPQPQFVRSLNDIDQASRDDIIHTMQHVFSESDYIVYRLGQAVLDKKLSCKHREEINLFKQNFEYITSTANASVEDVRRGAQKIYSDIQMIFYELPRAMKKEKPANVVDLAWVEGLAILRSQCHFGGDLISILTQAGNLAHCMRIVDGLPSARAGVQLLLDGSKEYVGGSIPLSDEQKTHFEKFLRDTENFTPASFKDAYKLAQLTMDVDRQASEIDIASHIAYIKQTTQAKIDELRAKTNDQNAIKQLDVCEDVIKSFDPNRHRLVGFFAHVGEVRRLAENAAICSAPQTASQPSGQTVQTADNQDAQKEQSDTDKKQSKPDEKNKKQPQKPDQKPPTDIGMISKVMTAASNHWYLIAGAATAVSCYALYKYVYTDEKQDEELRDAPRTLKNSCNS